VCPGAELNNNRLQKENIMGKKLTKTEAKQKRDKATHKLLNQLSVLSRTGTKADQKLVKKMQPLAQQLSSVA
jgi:hypothetical protein